MKVSYFHLTGQGQGRRHLVENGYGLRLSIQLLKYSNDIITPEGPTKKTKTNETKLKMMGNIILDYNKNFLRIREKELN